MHNAALILIDVQQAFDDPVLGQRNNPDAEKTIERLLALWRAEQRPIIHIHHHSCAPEQLFFPGKRGNLVKPEAAPLGAETVMTKSVNSAFIGTNLEAHLRAGGIDTVVLVGLTTDHCVSTTARMAGNLGFTTYVVQDACATFERRGFDGRRYSASQVHDTALASLHGEFATIVSSASLLAPEVASSVTA
jgi:nicotinamidase-related amidase